jgi:hypothetical protein
MRMGRWVLVALLLGGLVGCSDTPQTLELDRPMPSNRFHPVQHGPQPKDADRGTVTPPPGG